MYILSSCQLSLPHALMTYNLKRLREKPNKITTFFERKKAKTVFSLQENFFTNHDKKKIGKGYLLALNSSVFKLSIHKLEHCWLALYYVQKSGVLLMTLY